MSQTSKGRVRYVGPHAEGVVVVMPDGSWSPVIKPGEHLESTRDHVASLLEQASNWAPSDKMARKEAEKAEKEGES